MTAGNLGRSGAAARERDALAWLYRFSDWERGVGWSRDAAPEEAWKLGRTRALLDLAGAPDRRLRIVHVAGTKGKGSTVAYLCGNPDMIQSAEATLLEIGFPEEAVKKELYWPKGRAH